MNCSYEQQSNNEQYMLMNRIMNICANSKTDKNNNQIFR